MYGNFPQVPQNEKTPFDPISPYACAKVYAFHITKVYREAYGLFACNGILFNHESPRRGDNFVTQKIVKTVKDILNNKKKELTLGNLDSWRDWGHAKDYVYGMWLMLQQEKPDDFVLSTGITTSVRLFVELCFKKIGRPITWSGKELEEVGIDSNNNVVVKIDKKYVRPTEVNVLLGDSTKAREILKWEPKYDLNDLVNSMFNGEENEKNEKNEKTPSTPKQLVSVIINSYNNFNKLMKTINSIKNQTHKEIEIIVINDGSTQKDYSTYDWKDIKIIHLKENSTKKFGYKCYGDNINLGIKKSTGDFIAFCDDNFTWIPDKIKIQLKEINNKNYKMCSSDLYIGNGDYDLSKTYIKYNKD